MFGTSQRRFEQISEILLFLWVKHCLFLRCKSPQEGRNTLDPHTLGQQEFSLSLWDMTRAEAPVAPELVPQGGPSRL